MTASSRDRARADRRLAPAAKRLVGLAVACVLLVLPDHAIAADCGAASKAIADALVPGVSPTDAEAAFRKAVELCPELPEAHYNLALLLIDSKRFDEAGKSLEQALKIKKDPAFYLAVGNLRFTQSNLDGAEQSFEEALKIQPDFARALEGLSAVYLRRGDDAKAEQTLRHAAQLTPEDASIFYNLGIVSERTGRADEAIESYRAAVERDSSLSAAHLRLGSALAATGKLDEAERALRTAVLHAPQELENWMALASVTERKRDFPAALAAVERALAIDGSSIPALTTKGIILVKKGSMEDGLALLTQTAEHAPQDARTASALGWALLQKRTLGPAQEALERAVRLDDRDAFAFNNLGVLFRLKGEPEQAKRAFARAHELDPKMGEASANLEAAE